MGTGADRVQGVMRVLRAVRACFLLLTLNFLLVTPNYPQDTQENANFKLAVNLYNDAMYDLALEQFKQFISSYPNTQNAIEARFFLGMAHIELRQFEEARIVFQTFALTYPEHVKAPQAWWMTGEAYVRMEEFKQAASALERLKLFHPKSKLAPEALLKSSEYFQRAGDVENSRKVLRNLIDEYAASTMVLNAHQRLGTLYAHEGNHEQAAVEFDRVLTAEAPPELKAQTLVARGTMYQSMWKFEDAETDFRHVIDTYQTTSAAPRALLQLGKIQHIYGAYLEAVGLFRQLTDSTADTDTSSQQEALVASGDSYMKLLDYQNAFVTYEKFIQLFPRNTLLTTVYLKAGQALQKQNRYTKANTYYLRVLNADQAPEGVRRAAYLFSARNAASLKRYQEAVNFYAEFLHHYPEDQAAEDALIAMAQIYEMQLEDYPRAILTYNQFRREYPPDVNVDDALFGIARCYQKNKEFEKAVDVYADFLQQYPASELTGEVQLQLQEITNFELKNRDRGLEKLALLIGDVLNQRSSGDLSFRLAEIYFHDLKDYLAAARQHSNAINLGLDEDDFIDAYYFRARAFHLLSSKDEDSTPSNSRQLGTGSGLADSVLVYYEAFLKLYPISRWSEEAAYSQYLLASRSKSPEEVLESAEEFLSLYGTSRYADDVLNAVAEKALEQSDSELAIRVSQRLLSGYGNSDGASKALAQLAAGYLRSGKPDSAAHTYRQYIQWYPDGVDAARGISTLATLYADSNRTDESIPLYRTLLDEFFYTSFAERARVALGNAYLAAGRYEDAYEHFVSLHADVSDNPLISSEERSVYLYPLATALLKKGDRQAAKKYYLEYLSFDRTSTTAGEAYYALGTMARDDGNAPLATTFLKQASVLTGETKAAREAAELLFKNGEYQLAIEELSALAESASDPAEKRYYESRIIVASIRSANMTQAQRQIAAFEETYKDAKGELLEFRYETATLQFRNQEYKKSRVTFERVLKEDQGTRFEPWAHYWLGRILETEQKVSEATQKFEEILTDFPSSDVIARTHLALGNISYNAEQYEEAAKHFSFILENAETAPDLVYYAMNNLILVYEEVEVYDGALNLTRQFIARFPNDDSIVDKKVKLGVLYERLGYHDQAIVHLQSLLNVADSDLEAEIRFYIGESYYAKSEFKQALLEFLKIPYLVTKKTRIDWTANAFYMAGQSYEKMSKYDLAINMYQQIIDRPGIDLTFKAAAQKEINRVRNVTKTGSKP